MYRAVATSTWTDDTILSMSPEQKLLFLYLQTNPYASACGIYRMHPRTMAFQVGFMSDPFESALRGLAMAFPDFVAVDMETMEVALLQYPKQTLITANAGVMKHVGSEIEKVQSQYLLRELIARNSATISKPYLSQLRRLQMERINTQNDGDMLQVVEVQRDHGKTEIETEIESKEKERARENDSKIEPTVSIIELPDWKQVTREMYAYSTGEGRDEWEFIKAISGYAGDGKSIFAAWAGKASAYQLREWKKHFRTLGVWAKNEARAELRSAPRAPAQVEGPNYRIHKREAR